MTEPIADTPDLGPVLTHAEHRTRAQRQLAGIEHMIMEDDPDMMQLDSAAITATLMLGLVHAVLSLDIPDGSQAGGLSPAQIRLQQAGRL